MPIKINLRGVDNSFLFNLSGRVADYSLSFQLPGGNQTVVGNGGTVSFEDTTVDTTMAATVIATNRGSGPGTLETVSIAGGGIFELGGLGLLPATIPTREGFSLSGALHADRRAELRRLAKIGLRRRGKHASTRGQRRCRRIQLPA